MKQSAIRFPVLLFALGIYFPFGYVTAFLVGGIIRSLADRGLRKNQAVSDTNLGILCASGIIAGEAILGAILTIPFAYFQSTEVFALKYEWLTGPYAENIIGIVLYLGICAYLYKQGKTHKG